MTRSRLIDEIILIVLLIGVSTFPVNYFVHDMFWYYTIEALLMLAVYLFLLFYEKRNPQINPIMGRFNLTNFLWLLPAFIICGSNFFYTLTGKTLFSPSFELYSIPHAFFIIFNVLVEEIIFRKHLLGNLHHPKKIIRITIAAAIFGACHLTTFLSTFNPYDLIVVAYAFGLGMVLGLFYVYTNSLIACIALHLSFNMINDYLFGYMFLVAAGDIWYYLINLFVAIGVGIYLAIIYFFRLRDSWTY